MVKRKKITDSEVNNIVKNKGCELITPEKNFVNFKAKMKIEIKSKCGHNSQVTYSNFLWNNTSFIISIRKQQ